LYEQAVEAVRTYTQSSNDKSVEVRDSADGSAAISYNLGLTHRAMVICPRRAEGKAISGNKVALNGTILAGTLMVKGEEEWNTLLNDESQLSDVLSAIGIPSAKTAEKL
jgi:ATP adenylyltransferase